MAKSNRNVLEQTVETPQVETAPTAPVETKNPIVAAGHNFEALRDELKTKSAVIRLLASKGFKTGDIARFMDVRYQHVRNVLNQKSKKPAAE